MNISYSNPEQNILISVEDSGGNNMHACHIHATYELYVLISGQRKLFVKDNFFDVSSENIFLIKPKTEHRTIDAGDGRYSKFICNFSSDFLMNSVSEKGYSALSDDVIIISPSRGDLDRVFCNIEKIKKELLEERDGYELVVAGALFDILALLFRYKNDAFVKKSGDKRYERISEVIKYINLNFEKNISITSISQHFFISEFYMCRLFKECTGMSIFEYIEKKRILYAKKLLSESNIKINEIYIMCGYKSRSNFNRSFKQQTKKSPIRYRQENRFEV